MAASLTHAGDNPRHADREAAWPAILTALEPDFPGFTAEERNRLAVDKIKAATRKAGAQERVT